MSAKHFMKKITTVFCEGMDDFCFEIKLPTWALLKNIETEVGTPLNLNKTTAEMEEDEEMEFKHIENIFRKRGLGLTKEEKKEESIEQVRKKLKMME